MDKETPTYPSTTFLADVGGAAGLIFGLNIMETGFLFNEVSYGLCYSKLQYKIGTSVLIQLSHTVANMVSFRVSRFINIQKKHLTKASTTTSTTLSSTTSTFHNYI